MFVLPATAVQTCWIVHQ